MNADADGITLIAKMQAEPLSEVILDGLRVLTRYLEGWREPHSSTTHVTPRIPLWDAINANLSKLSFSTSSSTTTYFVAFDS